MIPLCNKALIWLGQPWNQPPASAFSSESSALFHSLGTNFFLFFGTFVHQRRHNITEIRGLILTQSNHPPWGPTSNCTNATKQVDTRCCPNEHGLANASQRAADRSTTHGPRGAIRARCHAARPCAINQVCGEEATTPRLPTRPSRTNTEHARRQGGPTPPAAS